MTPNILDKMDRQRYVSPSLEAQLRDSSDTHARPATETHEDKVSTTATTALSESDELPLEIAQPDVHTKEKEEEEPLLSYLQFQDLTSPHGQTLKSRRENAENVFDAHMPGCLPLSKTVQMGRLLENWPIKIGDAIFRPKVSRKSFLVFFWVEGSENVYVESGKTQTMLGC